jgi:hypothetical protein
MSSILFTTGLLATLLLFLFVFYLRLCVRERFFPLKGVAIGKPFFFFCVAVLLLLSELFSQQKRIIKTLVRCEIWGWGEKREWRECDRESPLNQKGRKKEES